MRDEFAEPLGYLDFGRFGPLSRTVHRVRHEAGERAVAAPDGFVDAVMRDEEQALAVAARLTGFPVDAVVTQPNTSTGLLHAAFGLPPGDVLVSTGEFPANLHPWQRAADAGRVRVRPLHPADGRVTPELVRAALDDRVVALAVSAVDSRTGYRADLPGLRDVLGDRLLIVDAIQGFGVTDEDWTVADVVATGGQKWLRSGWGTGFLACSPRALDRLNPTLSGWAGSADPAAFDRVAPAAAGAARFALTRLDPIAGAGFAAGLRLVESIGVARIEAVVAERVGELVQVVRSAGGLAAPRRSGILPVSVPGVPGPALAAALAGHGVTATTRPGHVRLSVHASTLSEVADLVHAGVKAARA
ncbi:aminotransferase class V-fold PLP-dependent enzyme [Amycolatopsis suaedae]|uniref:Aminotransferase class V-fold PLP-dependent enzyme n=1 Tax=Amycolatopsis suaedae TaxID=2510978 RepID=A0A4Q7J913_9PSEU|nr:aminotransferase class V-fold PLP-dependent enzyme [Amycolatopsis suaedae]RZQ63488.1 aminotransferase class V-fold PLP-dependent enzyme [Amycolatopsis suaedae]